jgi:CBS domain containing-hemolysin-like protein
VWVEGAWPTDDITVGEFVVRELGRLPEPGETIAVWDLALEIESIENDRISSVIVVPPALDDDVVEGEAD